MKTGISILVLSLISAITGCSSGARLVISRSDSVAFKLPAAVSSLKHDTVPPSDIEVVDISSMSRQFIVVGLAEAETGSLVEAVPLLRGEASKLGGDAVLDILPVPAGENTLSAPLVGDLSFRSGRVWTARVIRWLPSKTISMLNTPFNH